MRQHFHREISDIYTQIARLGGLVEEAIGKAVTCLYEGNGKLSASVREGDHLIDELEVVIEEKVLQILALYQPVARDLRFLVTALKVNNELEHMGDLAENIARKASQIPTSMVGNSKMEIPAMAAQVQKMVALALDALLSEDAEKARTVISLDDGVDRYHGGHHAIVAENLAGTGKGFGLEELKMLSVSRSLERIADLATSMAEDEIYFVEATIVRHRSVE